MSKLIFCCYLEENNEPEDNPKTKKERLKIPPEIVETKEEILKHIKERQEFYYPKEG